MPYVDVIQRSGLGLWRFKRLTTSLRSVIPKPAIVAAPVTMPAIPTIVAALPYALRVAREEAAQVEAARKAEAVAAAIRARETPTAVIVPTRPGVVVGRPYLPTTIRVKGLQIRRPIPLTYAHRPPTPFIPFAPNVKTESGSDYKTTQVEVVPPDIHAPIIGQSISLRETDPIVSLTATTEGIQIADETVPTFVEAAALEPSPWMKYGLLAIGGYILYDSFVKSKPKRRKRRRRR